MMIAIAWAATALQIVWAMLMLKCARSFKQVGVGVEVKVEVVDKTKMISKTWGTLGAPLPLPPSPGGGATSKARSGVSQLAFQPSTTVAGQAQCQSLARKTLTRLI